jgi:uncharacterized protein (TIGR03083 family)
MERDDAITIVQREAGRVLELANGGCADLSTPVPTCSEWDFAELLKHLGNVYNWAGTIVEGRLLAPPGPEIPRRPDGLSVNAWLGDRLERLLAALRAVPDDAVMWNFSPASPGPPAFWWRRQVHETVIHRVDAELTCAGPVTELEPNIAADTVSEFFELLRFADPGADTFAASATPNLETATHAQPPFIIHLHATDVEGAEWTVDTVARTISRSHAKGDVAIRGTSWALARWCWGRPAGGEIESFGDLDRAEAWRRQTASL